MLNKIVALAGSPRRRSHSGLLLESAIKGAQDAGSEVKLVYTNSLKIRPCQGCNTCYKFNGCIYHDDMKQLYEAFEEAHGFIISSPVYFGSVTAQLKLIIDRCQALWAAKQIAKSLSPKDKLRPGLFLATAGHPNCKGTRFDCSLEVVRTLGYAIDMKLMETVLVADTDRVPVTEESAVLMEAYEAGKRLGKVIA